MYKKGIQIENKYFLIEIVKKKEKIRVIIFDPNVSESYSLELSMQEAIEIMGGKEDYEYFVSLFRVQNDEIVLINPVKS